MPLQALDLARLLGLNPQVHQAVGRIAVQIEDSSEAAAMRLMTAADATGRSLDAIAADVVARRQRFTPHR